MCYSDYPGGNLINNLNVIVTDPKGKRYLGNGSTKGKTTMALDSTNNVEVIEVPKAKSGSWTVDVVGGNVPSGPQDFAVAAVMI
jgi:serine protease AprX